MSYEGDSWKVEDGKLELPSGMQMRAGCHHSRSASKACGGCYARAIKALEQIAAGASPRLAAKVMTIIRAEAKRPTLATLEGEAEHVP